MKKTFWSLIALLTLLSLLLSACNVPQAPTLSAQEILEKVQAQTAAITSARVKLTADMASGGVQLTITAEGAVQPPDKAYMKMNIMNQTIETLMLGPTEAYMNTGSGWQKISTAEVNTNGLNIDLAASQTEVIKYLKNLAYKNTEQVGGVDCYHLTFDLDLQKALELAMSSDLTNQLGQLTGTASGEMWVGAQDFYMHKLVLKLALEAQKQKVDVTLTLEMSDFNQPVTFPSPN